MHVHAKAMTMYQSGDIPEDIVELLKTIYTEQNVLTDSPFVTARVQR